MKTLAELVAMRLHEETVITIPGAGEDGGGRVKARIMRVPGGWLYSWYGTPEDSTFVRMPAGIAHVEGVDY